jgi:GH24 family phage-related lysozyme (muramidase)
VKLSPAGAELLKAIEVLSLRPYDDRTGGKIITAWSKWATIGYGHLIARVEWPRFKDGITLEEAEALFLADLEPFESAVNNAITFPRQQHEFDALVIMAFNIGIRAFLTSSLLKLLLGKPGSRYPTLEKAWKAFNIDEGKVNRGLVNRRNAEWKIFTRGVYERW